MKLTLKRSIFTEKSTIGRLYKDGIYFCWILEDKDRGFQQSMSLSEIQILKIHGSTCIPYGTYNVGVTFSNRFQKDLPILLNVPGFEGVRIHPGNTDVDTEGCLLPGTAMQQDMVTNSKAAWQALFNDIQAAFSRKEDITITIEKESSLTA